MQTLSVNGYSEDEVRAQLHRSGRTVAFKYELLDKTNVHMGWLSDVESASVANNALAQIKRTARFRILDEGINWLSDRVRPWFRLKMPDGGWAEWPLGIFLLATPAREVGGGMTLRNVDAYDQSLVLVDDKVADRYTVAAGTNYITAVSTLLTSAGVAVQNLVATSNVLPVARDWKPGTSKMEIINDLLAEINYRSLYFSGVGNAVAEPYQRPDVRPIGYTYAADDESVLSPYATHELDLFSVPNKWVAIVSEPDRPPLVASYTNTNANSPTSTVGRGRTIVQILEQAQAASQEVLDDKVERAAFEASQVYEAVVFDTATMPHHEDADLIEIDYSSIGSKARHVEHTWEMELRVGALMRHRIRRVVSV